jgi:AcrR family transcriptional regulator
MSRRSKSLDAGFPTNVPIRRGDDLGPKAQRTVERIIESARGVFLTNGYAGTTIDEIARVAELSRGSIYTYFPTKRDVLVAVGADSVRATESLIVDLGRLGRTRKGLNEWVAAYFAFLDVHGAFAFAWTEAAQNDEEIRIAGMKGHLRVCRDFSRRLAEATGATHRRPRDVRPHHDQHARAVVVLRQPLQRSHPSRRGGRSRRAHHLVGGSGLSIHTL